MCCFRRSLVIGSVMVSAIVSLQAQSSTTYPVRDPHTAGYVKATELPDGANAPADRDGNFILGPTHAPAPEVTVREGVPQAIERARGIERAPIGPGALRVVEEVARALVAPGARDGRGLRKRRDRRVR